MDFETICLLLTFIIIGFLSYIALKLMQLKNVTASKSNADNQNKRETRNNESSEGKVGTGVMKERTALNADDTMIRSRSSDTMLEVPSRQSLEKERLELTEARCIENASDDFTTIVDDEKESEDEGSIVDDYQAFNAFINEEKLNEYTDESGVLRGLMKYIDENIQIWMAGKLKIAIIGNSGTGKSSLINAIMGLKPEEKGAARVGLTETTLGNQEYVLPSNENISLWDLPGVGTQNFKKKYYLRDINLKDFDVFILVSASRFTENDLWLAKEIHKHERYVLFLRTKIDIDLNNEKSDHPSTYNVASCLQNMRTEIVNNLKKAKFPHARCGIFLVSSRQSSEFDFPILLNSLNMILSKRRFAVRKILECRLRKTLDKRSKMMKGEFFWQKVAIFLRFGDITSHTLRMYERCRISFSLDDNTLEMLSDVIGIPVMHLKTKELNYFSHCEEYLAKVRTIDYFAILLVSHNSLAFTNHLNEICDILAMDVEKLIILRLNRLEEQLKPL